MFVRLEDIIPSRSIRMTRITAGATYFRPKVQRKRKVGQNEYY